MTGAAEQELLKRLFDVVGAGAVRAGRDLEPELTRDESLGAVAAIPAAAVWPRSAAEVSAIVALARRSATALVARGGATGLSGGAIPIPGGILVVFERMNRILEVDEDDLVAVVEPGVTLAQLDSELAPRNLIYPVYPGESSATIGGNVATNAGGMRAIRHGVTRNNVLGLEVVLGTGETVRSGGKIAKSSTGYDLTQLLIGSEGTLGLVTEVTLRLQARARHHTTVLAPFASLDAIMAVIPPILRSGLGPAIAEYIDALTMAAITRSEGIELGIPAAVTSEAAAYLMVVLDQTATGRLDEDVAKLGDLLVGAGALEMYELPASAATELIGARERAFYVAKSAGADDIVDVCVPRSCLAAFLRSAGEVASRHGAFVVGCGHAGDGNVHLSVYQPDEVERHAMLLELFSDAMARGGVISGEHGIGVAKRSYFLELEDPAKIALMRRIKGAFDPDGILAPGHLLGEVAQGRGLHGSLADANATGTREDP